MTDTAPVLLLTDAPINPGVFERNLDALHHIHPDLADRIEHTAIPDTVRAVRTHDGLVNYRFAGPDGRQTWLGYTSMPSVSAYGVVRLFTPKASNLVVPGIGTGYEVRMIADTMPYHSSTIVLEHDELQLCLALRLADLSELLVQGRIILFCGADCREQLHTMLDEQLGYVVPDELLIWPSIADEQPQTEWSQYMQKLQDTCWPKRIELAEAWRNQVDDLDAERGGKAAYWPSNLSAGSPAKHSITAQGCRILVLSPGPGNMSARTAAAWHEACRQLGAESTLHTADTPDRAWTGLTQQAISSARPDIIVLVDGFRNSVQVRWPDTVPIISVLPSHVYVPPDERADTPTNIGNNDRLAWYTGNAHDLEAPSLCDDPRIIPLQPAADTATMFPEQPDDTLREHYDCDVAIVAPPPFTDHTHYNISWHTHTTIWEYVTSYIEQHPHQAHTHNTDVLLRRAECDTGNHLSDDQVRTELLDKITFALLPAVLRKTYIKAMIDAGIRPNLYGLAWQKAWPEVGQYVRPMPCRSRQLRIAYTAARLVVVIDPSGRVRPEVLDPIACGACTLVRAHERDHSPDGIGDILKADHHYASFGTIEQCVDKVRYLLTHEDKRRALARAGRQHLTDNHTHAHRLKQVLATIAQA